MAAPSVFVFLVAVGLAASDIGQDSFNIGKVAHSKDDAYYDFRYAVDDEKSGVVADRWETRSGRFVKGAYSLLGPDGKVRTVHYEVDGDHGFKAVVRTDTPRLNLLSIQSAHQVHLTHADPPINKEQDSPLPQLPPGEKPYNYHARPDPLRQRPPPPLPSPALVLAPIRSSLAASLFSNDLRPIDDENLQALQDLKPPAIDAFSRTYDSYPRPVRTNPNRRQEPVHDVHRTVYSDYVNKELQRISPQRSARLVKPPVLSRGLIVPVPLPVAIANPSVPAAAPAKRNDQVSHQPVPDSRHWSRPLQFSSDPSPSYFL